MYNWPEGLGLGRGYEGVQGPPAGGGVLILDWTWSNDQVMTEPVEHACCAFIYNLIRVAACGKEN